MAEKPPPTRLGYLKRHEVRELLWGRESFFPALALALTTVLAFPIGDRFLSGYLVTLPLAACTILVAFHRAQVSQRSMRVATIVVICAATGSIVAQTVSHGTENRITEGLTAFFVGMLLFFALPAITRRAFAHRRVSLNTLAAAVTAYLFIGLFFTAVYRFIDAVEVAPFFKDLPKDPGVGSFQYFSFITLTTVGYGDLTPATDAGRSAAVFEALGGQVFLVTAVARIVSLLGQERDVPSRAALEDRLDADAESADQ
jgi:hypothetical protein